MRVAAGKYGLAAKLVAAMGKDDAEVPKSITALREAVRWYTTDAQLVATMGKDDAKAPKNVKALRDAVRAYITAVKLVATMGKDDAKAPKNAKATKDAGRAYAMAAKLVAAMGKDDAKVPSSAAALRRAGGNYGLAAELVAAMGKDDTEAPSSAAALRRVGYLFGPAAQLVATMGKDDAEAPSSAAALQNAGRTYGLAAALVATMGKDDTKALSSIKATKDAGRAYAMAAQLVAAMGKDDAEALSSIKAMRRAACKYGIAAQQVAALGKDDATRPRSAEELAATKAWVEARIEEIMEQAKNCMGVDMHGVVYPELELIADWVRSCVYDSAELCGHALEVLTAYACLTGTSGGAISRVAPEYLSYFHHKAVACAQILSDGSNADSWSDALPYEDSIFKGAVAMHVLTDMSMRDATLSGYLVLSSTAKTPAVETAAIQGVYALIDDGKISAPHTGQLNIGGGGQGANMHAEEAAIKARRAAEALRASGVDATRPDVAAKLRQLDAAAQSVRRKKEVYLLVGMASEKDEKAPVWIGSVSYYDKFAKLVARYKDVSAGLPGRQHLAGSNIVKHTELYK